MLNNLFEVLKARIRNKQFVEAERTIEHGEFSDEQLVFANAFLLMLRDEKPGELISLLKSMPEGDEKSEGLYLMSNYYLKKNDMRQFTRYKRELADRSKLPFERGLFSLLSAKERRRKKESETAISFVEEGIKVLRSLNSITHKEYLAMTYHEGAINFVALRRFEDSADYLELALKAIQEHDLPFTRGKILSSFGNMYYQIDELNRALVFYEHAVDEKVKINDPVPSAITKLQMVSILEDVEDYEKAEVLLTDILNNIEDNSMIRSLSFSAYGRICAETQRQKEAINYFQKAISYMVEESDPYEIATLENDIGMLFLELEEEEKAEAYFLQSLEKWKMFESLTNIANVLTNLARTYLNMADYERATQTMEEALQVQREIGVDFTTATALSNLGYLYLDRGEIMKAKAYFQEGLELKRKMGDEKLLTDSYNQLALVSIFESDLGQVETFLVQARECCFSGQEDTGILDSTINLGIFKFYNKELEQAEQLMWEAFDFSRNIQDNMAGFEALEYLRRMCVKRPMKKIEVIQDELKIIKDLTLSEIKSELSIDLALNYVLLYGSEDAQQRFSSDIEEFQLDRIKDGDMEVVRKILSFDHNPVETLLAVIDYINSLMKRSMFLINRSIFYSQVLVQLVEKIHTSLDEDSRHEIVEALNNLLSTSMTKKIDEFETLCHVLLSLLNKKNLREIKLNSNILTGENYVELLLDPTCWLPDADVPVDPVFRCVNQLMILQYSIPSGTVDVSRIKDTIGVSSKLVSHYIQNLVEAEYLYIGEDGTIHFSEVGMIKFRIFISSLKAILITKLSI